MSGDLYCGFCNRYFTDIEDYESHCQLKSHIKKLLRAHKIKVKDVIMPGEEKGVSINRFCPKCLVEIKMTVGPNILKKNMVEDSKDYYIGVSKYKDHHKILIAFVKCPYCETELVSSLMKTKKEVK